MKKKFNLAIFVTAMLSPICACSNTPADPAAFTELLGDQPAVTIKAGETYTLKVEKPLSNKNYIKFVAKNSDKLRGSFTYHDINNSEKKVTEDFYIEKADNDFSFKQFFDAFRTMGVGYNMNKVLDYITFTNINDTDVTLDLAGVYISGRVIDDYAKEIYLQKGSIKIGADLSGGGTLSFLSRSDYYETSIDEVIDNDGNVVIGVNAKENCKRLISSSVNLINYYDAGRQFQQSFYAAVGGAGRSESERQSYTGPLPIPSKGNVPDSEEQNGYRRSWCYTATTDGYYWPYNPVQGGDAHNNISQIIDYEVKRNYIYVKTRALDWAKNNVVSESYMENKYEIDDGIVYVHNSFINWAGFKYDKYVPSHSLELPAAYVVHPLHNLVVYKGTKPWTGDMNYDRQSSLGSWAAGAYHNSVHKEDWFAWVNDSDFGVAVYIPGAGTYASGRSNATTSSTYKLNCDAFSSPMANEYLYNKAPATDACTSCYVHNTSYTAPVISTVMKDYVPFTYTYAISVDMLSSSRNTFKMLHEYEIIDNSGLKAWDK